MLKIPTVVNKSNLKDCELGVFVTEPVPANSILVQEDTSLQSIQLTKKQFDLIVFNIAQLKDTEQKKKLLKILELFNYNKSKLSLIISNLAYMNYNSNEYNVQYINNNLYSIRDIQSGEELVCSSIKVINY